MNAKQAQLLEQEAGNEMVLEIGFKRLSENAVLPTKAYATDSGFDLYAAEDVIIAPGETVVVPTDIAVVLPENHEGVVRPRSGITSKTKLRVQIGSIDNSYRGNVGIIVDNIATKREDFGNVVINITEKPSDIYNTSYFIEKGNKIAQLVVQPIPDTVAVEVFGELDDTSRGKSGFGSSGV